MTLKKYKSATSKIKRAYNTRPKRIMRKRVTRKPKSAIPLSRKINTVKIIKESRYETLQYTCAWNRTTNGTTESSYSSAFRMASIWDPDVNGVAKDKSVSSYSLLASLYKQYKVYGFKASVTFINKASTSVVVFLATADSAQWVSAFATNRYASDIISRPGIKYRVLGPSGSTTDTCTIRINQMPRTALGLNAEQWSGDPTRGALFGANPSATDGKEAYFVVGQSAIVDNSVAVSNVDILCSMHFGTKIWDPIENPDQ